MIGRRRPASPDPWANRMRLAPLLRLGGSIATLIAAALTARGQAPAPPEAPSATTPATRPGFWLTLHRQFVERARRGDVDLLFLGDSITAGWDVAPSTWDRYYAPRRAARFGIPGDATQHLLQRIEDGEVDGIKPKVVVLLIGTNNLISNTEAEVAAGVGAVVAALRRKLPDAQVLLLGLFPRATDAAPNAASAPPDPRIARVNARLARLDDRKQVKYLDVGVHFLDAAGRVNRATLPDLLHLNPAAYRTLAEAIEPTLGDLMEAK